MTAFRIGLITGEYPPMRGGIATQTQLLAHRLSSQGHTVHVLTSIDGKNEKTDVNVSATVERWGLRLPHHLNQWIKENKLQLVNVHYQTAAYGMSPIIHFIPAFASAPVITTFHDLRFPYLFPKAGLLRPWIVDHLATSSQAVVSTNQEDDVRLSSLNHNHALIPIGSNITSSTATTTVDARTAIGAKSDDFIIAFFGFVNRTKGLDVLLQAISVLQSQDIPAKLLMIGDRLGSSDPTNRAYNEQIEALITDFGLQNTITWTGFVSDADVQAYLTSADVVALPFRDGASYRRSSLTSAIAQKSVIVTTRPTVDVPAFRHGENMLLTPPGDVPALTSALMRLYNNPALRESLRGGTAQLQDTFSWDRIVTDYIQLYRKIIESHV